MSKQLAVSTKHEPNRFLKWNIPAPETHAMLDAKLTRGIGCAVSLGEINIASEISSQNSYPATLFLFYLFSCHSYTTHSRWGKRDH